MAQSNEYAYLECRRVNILWRRSISDILDLSIHGECSLDIVVCNRSSISQPKLECTLRFAIKLDVTFPSVRSLA